MQYEVNASMENDTAFDSVKLCAPHSLKRNDTEECCVLFNNKNFYCLPICNLFYISPLFLTNTHKHAHIMHK